jgi:hypothetical protein
VTTFLVIANPPQPGEPDPRTVGPIVGLDAFEMRGKLGNPLPEVWLVTESEETARAKAAALENVGVRCTAVAAEALLAVPEGEEAVELTLGGEGLGWKTEGGAEGDLLWSELRVAIHYRTIHARRRDRGADRKLAERVQRVKRITTRRHRGVAGALIANALSVDLPATGSGTMTFENVLELGAVAPDGPRRVVFVRSRLNYEGLGSLKTAGAQQNWATFLAAIAERAKGLSIDRRGETTMPRPTVLKGVGLAKLLGALPEPARARLDAHEVLVALACHEKGVSAPESAAAPEATATAPPPAPPVRASFSPIAVPRRPHEEGTRSFLALLLTALLLGAGGLGLVLARRHLNAPPPPPPPVVWQGPTAIVGRWAQDMDAYAALQCAGDARRANQIRTETLKDLPFTKFDFAPDGTWTAEKASPELRDETSGRYVYSAPMLMLVESRTDPVAPRIRFTVTFRGTDQMLLATQGVPPVPLMWFRRR